MLVLCCARAAAASGGGGGGGGGVSVGAIIGIAVAAVDNERALYLPPRPSPTTPRAALGTSLAAAHCTEFALDEILQMADKNHPNIVRLLGFAVGGDVSFGVLMLVVLTGRPPLSEDDGESKQIVPWASSCLSSNDTESLKDARMDAPPGDAVLHVAELAVSCTVERTASRPSMAHIATQLQAVMEEVAGKKEFCAAIKVDAQIQEMKDAVAGVESLETQLRMIGDQPSG
ncbi:unnamed protein product [Closterium sp. NIES-65]|nr:unnamed protein product [Closterium sp. NIES-65]